jgi:hypothetical protein
MTAQPRRKKTIQRALALTVVIVLSPLWIPFIALWFVFYVLASIFLYLAIWALWLPRSKHILFVYSDSPIWHDYIEEHILPVIRDRAVVLNWSQRRSRLWRRSLAVAAFKHFGGWRDFNPMAVVFRPFQRARVFRFLPAFREFKHGRPEKLLTMQQEFFDYSRADAIRPKA